MSMSDSLSFDVVIVGAGPAGLATAIRLKQLCQSTQTELSVCILEKGSQVGAHILSGAVIDPIAINELIPNWQAKQAPLHTQVTQDYFYFLTAQKAWRLPTPGPMKNHGNYIVSLSEVTRWLAKEAESLGVEIFAGFPAVDFIFNDQNEVVGIKTQAMGRDKNGNALPTFQAGVEIFAKTVVLAEGCHGSLSKQAIQHFSLRNNQNQTYGLGLKELWRIPKSDRKGHVMHTLGWPLDNHTYGGGFLYYLDEQTIALGLVIGLDYQNPYLNTFQELQRFKHHPLIAKQIENGECLSYGARAINEGGWQALPTLCFPGGVLVGCAAGFLNVPRIKGSHLAMKSGMLAAESIFKNLGPVPKVAILPINKAKMVKKPECTRQYMRIFETFLTQLSGKSALSGQALTQNTACTYQHAVNHSWIKSELYPVRNLRPAFKWGCVPGLIYAAIDTYVFQGHTPWTFSHHSDFQSLKPAHTCEPITYPKPDGKISFDLPTQLSRSQTHHRENQFCHLVLQDPMLPEKTNWPIYAGPEARYCPAGVYEYVNQKLIINGQNCLHCKTCDIKDPEQNINWIPPEGGDGPEYERM